ncbi:MAG TPA: glycosyltransferase, partial [Thermoleophilaceae bacterium]
MRILFAVKPHLPAVGGAQQTMHWLALGLQRRGHDVAVLASSSPHPEQRVQPPELGYPLTVSARPERILSELAEAFAADVVVAGAYDESCARTTRLLLRAAAPRPTLLHVHDAAGAPLADEHPAAIVAVSEHVRRLIEARGASATVSLPPLEHAHYRVASSRRTALLINPVPKKGIDRVLDLAAARPDVPFALTLAWHMSRNALTRLRV